MTKTLDEKELRRNVYDQINAIYDFLQTISESIRDMENAKQMEEYSMLKRVMSDVECCLMIVS